MMKFFRVISHFFEVLTLTSLMTYATLAWASESHEADKVTGANGDVSSSNRLQNLEGPVSSSYFSKSQLLNKTQFTGLLKSEATKYQSSVADSKLNQSFLVSVDLRAEYNNEETQSVVDFTAERFVDWQHSQFSVKELYWGRNRPDTKTERSLGRKLEYWSVADDEWSLGLWQPKQAFDGLRPQSQGLTGIFIKHQDGDLQWLGLISPMFIPTMEPEIKNDDGNLSAESRWFRSPSSTFILFNKQRRIVYSIKSPNLSELVIKPGIGARVKAGKELGTWGGFAVGYKPINKLLVKYEKKLVTDGQNDDTGNAPLYPLVGYHSLVSGDLGYNFKNYKVSFSYLEDRPTDINQGSDDPYIVQRPAPSKVYSWLISANLQYDTPTKLSLGYLRVDGGDIADFDAQGNYEGAVFSSRYQFTHAVQAKGEIKTYLRNKELITKLKYLRDFDQRGVLWGGEFNLYPRKDLVVILGGDVLGGDKNDADAQASGFLNEFRANDRAYAGVGYVF